ncbi:MAG: tRNA 2-selenouridine(34) synthase MnmH, partial [Pseudomonadota bacterium]
INLPVLDNAERAEVGTIYKQVSPFRARKIGAAKVFRNAARHIETALAHHEGGWRPLVYCWRGGQRSGAFAWMLKEIGWRAEVIEGGYRAYRRLVSQMLYEAPLPHRLVRLGGLTGTAKTEILGVMAAQGLPVIDLEALANHRGSLLGDRATPQPSQKAFESALAQDFLAFDPATPVIVEAESSKIGALTLPPSLWALMKDAPILELTAPLEARAHYLARAYEDILAEPDALMEKLAPLRRVRGAKVLERWEALARAGDHAALCHALAVDHYDPAYRRAQSGRPKVLEKTFELPDLEPDSLAKLAPQIAERAHEMVTPAPSTMRPISAAS